MQTTCLNPYSNGITSLGSWVRFARHAARNAGLNPYSNGITSLGPEHGLNKPGRGNRVLILILMELPHWVFKRTLLKP